MVILYSQDYGPDVGRPSSKKPPRLYCLGFLGWESHFEIRTLLLVASSKKPPMIKNVTLTLSMFNNFLIFCSNCSFSKFSSSVTKTSVNSNLCSSLNFFLVFRMSTKCLMLIQPTKRPEGRNYTDYNTRAECFDAICKIYENMLKRQNPSEDSISYDMQQV